MAADFQCDFQPPENRSAVAVGPDYSGDFPLSETRYAVAMPNASEVTAKPTVRAVPVVEADSGEAR